MKTLLARQSLLFIILITLLFLGACTGGEDTPQVATLVPTVPPTKAAPPTDVPTPPPALAFLAGAGSDPTLLAQLEPVVMQFAVDAGYIYERRETMGPDSAPQNTQFVVAVGNHPNLADMLLVMPGVQFVVVGMDGLPLAPNLTSVNTGANQSNMQAFMAGYIAALQDTEYRVGIISLGDAAGQQYRQSFLNGAIYFCGYCNPIYPPYWEYPLFYEVPPGASPEMWQQAAEDLISRSVTTIHVATGVADDRLPIYLAQRGLMIVGASPPPTEALANWIASVEMDMLTGFQQILWDVLQGGAKGQVSLSLSLTNINPHFISEGRLSHLDEIMERLENGMIDPLGE